LIRKRLKVTKIAKENKQGPNKENEPKAPINSDSPQIKELKNIVWQ
jgi:hypothetical protein